MPFQLAKKVKSKNDYNNKNQSTRTNGKFPQWRQSKKLVKDTVGLIDGGFGSSSSS